MRDSYFLIMNTATRECLPYGGTQAEFADDLPPRLFTTRSGACSCLRKWLQGHWRATQEWEATNEYGEGYYVQGLPAPSDSKFNLERAAQRQALPIAIVEVVLRSKL